MESNSHMFATFNLYIIQAFFFLGGGGGGGGRKGETGKKQSHSENNVVCI